MSRLVLARIILVFLLAAGCAASVQADTVNVFAISGTAVQSCLSHPSGVPIPGCTPTLEGFAGGLEVDVTTGIVLAAEVLGPAVLSPALGTPVFSVPFFGCTCIGMGPLPNGISLSLLGGAGDFILTLDVTTPLPGSLVSFDGGAIIGGSVSETDGIPDAFIRGGSITPAIPTPEPSSLALIALGLGALMLMRKRMIRPLAV
jgi:hypothetical protein